MSTESMMKREIRLGVVMTGGVSLAVWMGGVSLELYRAVAVDREGGSSSVYEGLKALTSTDISVDVISGTSAGGLNGVLLAAAVAYRRPEADVRSLRDIWLNVGNLRDLIRPPNDTDPRSVLRGDGAFLPPVLKVLRDFIDEGEPAQADVTLGLTTTLIHPEVVRHTDDLGDDMAQPNHRGTFRFEFVKRQVPGFGAQHMARAARSSASFPGAFEASLVDEFPDENISFAIPRWVFDGGILNNQPLGIALDSMADRQASTEVRRVVAFVVPDPVMLDPLADRSDEAPTLGGVLAATVSIPMQQSIHDDLERLRRTNGRIEQQILSRRLIRLWDEDLESVAVQLQQLYLRVHSSYAAMYALRLMPDAWSPSIRQGVANAFASARSVLLSEALAERDEEAGQIETFEGVEWGYGIFGCRYVIETALGVIRRLLRSDRVKGPDGETSLGDQRQRLEEIFGELHQLRRIVRGVRDQDRNFWRSFFRDLDVHDDPGAAIGNQFEVWSDVDVEGEPVGVVLTTIAWRSVGLLVETRTLVVEEPDADEIVGDLAPADGDPGGDDLVGGEAEAGDGDLGDSDEMAVALGELIALTPVVAGQNPVDSAMRYMVSLFILNTVAGGASASEEREIGLVQISARAPSLDPHHPSPADKLSGVQLGHFGAFFKRSWRANDWMWGRSDGADRIVRILLEPGRLRRCYLVPEECLDALGALYGELSADIIGEELELPPQCSVEIAALWNGETERLDATWQAFAHLAQLDVLVEELPVVAAEAAESTSTEGGTTRASKAFVDAVRRELDDAGRLKVSAVPMAMRELEIARESWVGELKSDLGTDIASRALASAASALSFASGKAAAPFVKPVERISGLVYHVAQASVARTALGNALIVVLLASALTVLATDLASESVTMSALVRSVAVGVLVVLYVAVPDRRRRMPGLVVLSGATLIALAAAPTLAFGAEVDWWVLTVGAVALFIGVGQLVWQPVQNKRLRDRRIELQSLISSSAEGVVSLLRTELLRIEADERRSEASGLVTNFLVAVGATALIVAGASLLGVQDALHENRPIWIAAGMVVVLLGWGVGAMRRR